MVKDKKTDYLVRFLEHGLRFKTQTILDLVNTELIQNWNPQFIDPF
jgi:hypothetical protein